MIILEVLTPVGWGRPALRTDAHLRLLLATLRPCFATAMSVSLCLFVDLPPPESRGSELFRTASPADKHRLTNKEDLIPWIIDLLESPGSGVTGARVVSYRLPVANGYQDISRSNTVPVSLTCYPLLRCIYTRVVRGLGYPGPRITYAWHRDVPWQNCRHADRKGWIVNECPTHTYSGTR